MSAPSPAERLVTELAFRFRWSREDVEHADTLTADMIGALAATEARDVAGIVERIVRTRPYRTMPSVREILDAREHVIGERAPKLPLAALPEWVRKDLEARDYALTFVRLTGLGRQARDEGWERSLSESVQSTAREMLRAGKSLPRVVDFDFELSSERIEHYRRHGQRYSDGLRQQYFGS